MPVTTRSQSKKRIHEINNTRTLRHVFTSESNPETQLSKSDTEFINDLKNRLNESKKLKSAYLNFKRMAALTRDKSKEEEFMREYKRGYFKNLCHITEMFRFIDSMFDVFFVSGGKVSTKTASIQKLIDIILTKWDEFPVDVEISCPTNLTEEHTKVLDDFKVQLQKTKALFEPYGSSKKEPRYPKRSIRPMCYTGMDMLEPESICDGITDIWTVRTILIDPDYVYESDEDDEDEDDDESYVSDDNEDEEEFEDYDSDGEEPWVVYEDDPEDCFDQEEEDNDFIVEKVNDRHIRFVYK